MKFRLLCLAAFCLLPFAFCLSGQAQYSIDWWKVAGGGGTSSNGQYSLSGTIGQPDAGVMSGGSFTLFGGFWSIVGAVQTPGAPFLSVWTTLTNTVVVSWPSPAPGWTLEYTSTMVSPPATNTWTPISPPYQTGPTNLYFVEPSPIGNRFYHLRNP